MTILLPHACTGWGTARPVRNETTTRPASHTVLTRRIRDLETRRPSRGDKGPGHQESPLEKGLDHHGKPLENEKGLPAHPVEPTYPCCLSALGEFGQVPPRGEPCIHTRAPPNPPPNQPAVFEPHSCPDSWIGALRESTPVSRSLNGAAQRRGCQTLIPAQAVVRPHDRCHERVTSSAGSELGM